MRPDDSAASQAASIATCQLASKRPGAMPAAGGGAQIRGESRFYGEDAHASETGGRFGRNTLRSAASLSQTAFPIRSTNPISTLRIVSIAGTARGCRFYARLAHRLAGE
jgi:hypothetical protein